MDIRRIKRFSAEEQRAWDDFIGRHPAGTLFHLSAWRESVERSFGHVPYYLIAVDNRVIKGVLPLFYVKSLLLGKSLVSIPFGVYGGVCADTGETETLLLEEAKAMAKEFDVDYLELRNVDSRYPGLLTKDLYVTFKREIYQNPDENMAVIPRKQRRMIRVGMKSNLKAEIGSENLSGFYDIYAQSCHNHGTPVFPLEYFDNLMSRFGNKCKILSVWHSGRMVAGVMTFFFKNRVMPYYGGARKEYFRYAVNDFMYWELMKHGCEEGYKVFDFGRSKRDTGPYSFKIHWGFEPSPLSYQYFMVRRKDMPNFSPANPRFGPMIALWKRLPLSLTKTLGPRIVKYIA